MSEVSRYPLCVVFLVRHGRTNLNAAGLLRGRLDPPLDTVGIHQARALGHVFKGAPVCRVVASPLLRAVETARSISEAAEAELVIDDRFADRDYGPWAGKSLEEVEARFGSVDDAPGVEGRLELTRRVLAGFGEAAASATSRRPVVVVAHDVVNRLILGPDVLGPDAPDDLIQPPGCWNRLELGEQGWTAPVFDAVPGEDVLGGEELSEPRAESIAQLIESRPDPILVSEGATLAVVLEAMQEAEAQEAFVVDNPGQFRGFVTRGDAQLLLDSGGGKQVPTVTDVILRDPVTVGTRTPPREAVRRAAAAGQDRVVVLNEDGRPVGALKLVELEEMVDQ